MLILVEKLPVCHSAIVLQNTLKFREMFNAISVCTLSLSNMIHYKLSIESNLLLQLLHVDFTFRNFNVYI